MSETTFLAYVVLCGNAVAATEYAVDGLAVGTQLNFGTASYREYKCSPSDQFEGPEKLRMNFPRLRTNK